MDKFFLILFSVCFVHSYAIAQESLYPLKYNPVYPQNTTAKSYVENFDHLCLPPPIITIENLVSPDACEASTGSFTLNFNELPPPFDYTVKKVGESDPIAADLTPETTVTFNNLGAGAYVIDIIDGENQSHQILQAINDTGESPIEEGTFTFRGGRCGDEGRIQKNTFSGEIFNFFISDIDGNRENDWRFIVNDNKRSINLPVGQYIIQRVSLDSGKECFAISFFEIENLPENEIPFTDDFSTTNIYPDFAKWEDDYAFINNNLPITPPSIGVATLDGLNQYGQPYASWEGRFIDGSADILTSHPFCLSDNRALDLSGLLYLNFRVQAAGNGDYPNQDDSLLVEFKRADGTWKTVFDTTGFTNPPVDSLRQDFSDISLAIPVAQDEIDFFQHDDFQFRFRSYATLTGGNDHWHIDFVRLSSEPLDEFIADVSFSGQTRGLLKNYSAMPWKQFINHIDTELADNVEAPVFSSQSADANNINLSNSYSITDVCLEESLLIVQNRPAQGDFTSGNFPNNEQKAIEFTVPTDIDTLIAQINRLKTDPSFVERDSVVWHLDWRIDGQIGQGVGDIIPSNDQINHYQKFFNYYAYDDGSAEAAWGLNVNSGTFAYEFNINEPDTLIALQIGFVNMNENVLGNGFDIVIYESIDTFGTESTILYREEGYAINQFQSVNGFWTYQLNQGVPVQGKIYVGLIQNGEDFMNIGYDRNNVLNQKLWVNYNGTWEPSVYDGALMVRPVMGEDPNSLPDNINVGVEDPLDANHQLRVYPNPTQGELFIELESTITDAQAIIYDLTGRAIIQQNVSNQTMIDLYDVPSGIYLVKVFNQEGQVIGVEKIMVD